MKIHFNNATIIDGSGDTAFLGSVLVEGNRIMKVLKADESASDNLTFAEDYLNIDLKGQVLAPGFIDSHSHNDWFCLKDDVRPYFDSFVKQGITSLVAGNCGFSATGFSEDSPYLDDLGGELFNLNAQERRAEFADWMQAIDGRVPINVASLIGHGTARLAVAGISQTELTAEQEEQMLVLLEQGLKQGAAGISLGLMYAPGLFAPTSELEKVADLCAKYDRILTVHPRAESAISLNFGGYLRSHLLQALDELDHLTRKSGCRFEYSHLIFVGRRSWKDIDEALAILEKLESDGFEVGFDMYPFDYGASVITVVLPEWYQRLPKTERKKRSVYLKLKLMLGLTVRLLGFGFDDIVLAYAGEKHPDYNGYTISEIAKQQKRAPLDVYLEVCEDSDFKARVLMGGYQNDEMVERLMCHPMSVYMTDAWYEEKGIQNGGIYGAFPRFLKIAREKNMPLEMIVHKMTGKSAQRFSIDKRGLIREGYYADLVIFDPDRVSDNVKLDAKSGCPGISRVYVNGNLQFSADQGLTKMRNNSGESIFVR